MTFSRAPLVKYLEMAATFLATDANARFWFQSINFYLTANAFYLWQPTLIELVVEVNQLHWDSTDITSHFCFAYPCTQVDQRVTMK